MSINGARYIKKLKIDIKNISPIHIGGEGEELLADYQTGNIIIQGTTMAGAFKSYLKENNKEVQSIFGGNNNQSKVFFYDSFSKILKKESRKSIAIDDELGCAKNGALLNRKFYASGHMFNLELDIYANDMEELEYITKNIESAIIALNEGIIAIGKYKSIGAGLFSVEKVSQMTVDVHDKKQLFSYIKGENKFIDLDINKISKSKDLDVSFVLNASIKTPLLVGADSLILDSKFKVRENMKSSEGNYIIPGSTIKGIIRSQAKKILKYFDKMELENEIFGQSGDKNIASKIKCFDCVIKNDKTKIYNRVKIDKFTSGTIDGAMLRENTVVGDIKIESRLSIKDENVRKTAIALISAVYRDLALESISIGSGFAIGRGIIKPKSLEIKEADTDIYNYDFIKEEVKVDNVSEYFYGLY